MSNDPHDNEADDRAMLRKLRDQEDTMDNDEQLDYAEEQYNKHLLDDETSEDPDEFEILVTRDSRGFQISAAALRQAADSGSAVIRFTAPDGFRFGDDRRLHPDTSEDPEGEAVIPGTHARHGYPGDINDPERFPGDDEVVPSDLPGGRTVTRQGHRAAALQLIQYWSDSDAQDFSTPRERDQDNLAAALTQAVLALSAPASPEPDSIWRQRAVEAEAALTAIGGILVSENGIVRKAELISGVLRESGQQADRLMAPDTDGQAARDARALDQLARLLRDPDWRSRAPISEVVRLVSGTGRATAGS